MQQVKFKKFAKVQKSICITKLQYIQTDTGSSTFGNTAVKCEQCRNKYGSNGMLKNIILRPMANAP